MAEGNNISGKDLLYIGGGVVAFFAIKKVLVKLGIATGEGEQSVINNIANPYSPWKPQYWQEQNKKVTVALIKRATAEGYARTIHNAFGIFQDDFNAILSVFSALKTKTQVSFLSQVFAEMYKEDMLSFLTDGGGILPWDGLSDAHLKQLTDLVNRLKTY